jgi:hypothetical protein
VSIYISKAQPVLAVVFDFGFQKNPVPLGEGEENA